jgi:hypothetical protein
MKNYSGDTLCTYKRDLHGQTTYSWAEETLQDYQLHYHRHLYLNM